MGEGQRGSVIVVVLVLMLALELLAHGAFLLAREEEAASRAGVRLLQARLAAERALRLGDAPLGVALGDVPPGSSIEIGRGTLGVGRWRVGLERLGRESWLARGEGGVRGAGWWTGLGVLAWLPDPVERLRAFAGVVVVWTGAPVRLAGAVETDGVRGTGAVRDPAACAPRRAVLDSLYGGAPPAAVAVDEHAPAGEPSLGALGPRELLAWIGDEVGAEARAVHGDLTLRGEEGHGLLVVEGDLELVGGRHEGLLLVGGRLVLREGSELVGFARAMGGVDVERGSRVLGSGCAALLALERSLEAWVRPLIRGNRPFPVP